MKQSRKIWYYIKSTTNKRWWNGRQWCLYSDQSDLSNMAVVLKKKKAVKISKQAVKGILIKRFIRKGVIQDIEYLFDFES